MAASWYNEPLMRKTYKDIRRIRDVLLASVAESGFENFWTGMDRDCTSNPHSYCTSESLYITMERYYEGYAISKLYTPFGMLQLLNGGYVPELVTVSDIFMKKLKQEYATTDVTNSHLVSFCFETKDKCTCDFAKAKPDTILLRVDAVEGKEFDSSNVLFAWGRDYDEAKAAFKKASHGKDFC